MRTSAYLCFVLLVALEYRGSNWGCSKGT